jgi:putative nucleotidyltransferase with HDIG domain
MSVTNSTYNLSFENNAPLTGHYPSEKINGIYDFCRQLVATNTLDVLLDSIVRQAVEILHVRFCRILTLEPDGTFVCQAAHSADAADQANVRGRQALSQARALYQHVVLSEAPVMIGQGNNLSAELRIALRLGHNDNLYLIPLRVDTDIIGLLALGEEYQPVPETLLKEKIRMAVMIADQAASAVHRSRLSYRLEESQLQTVMALAKVMESRDAYVGRHSRKVTALAVRIAKQLECPPGELQAIRWAAILHDIGKVGIKDDILHKNGPLTKEEWRIMRRHPESGAEIVRMASNLDFVASIILAHHERFDGSGYPNGLRREMIPFGARILAVADAYSAMTDERPYKPSFSQDEAITELRRCSGTQFDPAIVEVFIRMIS